MSTTPFIGSKISLISKAEIRYEGILYQVDTGNSTVTLAKVRSFGTEDRPTAKQILPRNDVYEFIIFRGSDIKDLNVSEMPEQHGNPLPPQDPAILSAHSSVPPASVPSSTPGAPPPPLPLQSHPPNSHPPHGPPPYFPRHPPPGYSTYGVPYFRPPVMMGPGGPPHHPHPQHQHQHPHPPLPGHQVHQAQQLLPPPPAPTASPSKGPPPTFVSPQGGALGAVQTMSPSKPMANSNNSSGLVATPIVAPASVEVKPQASSTPLVAETELTSEPEPYLAPAAQTSLESEHVLDTNLPIMDIQPSPPQPHPYQPLSKPAGQTRTREQSRPHDQAVGSRDQVNRSRDQANRSRDHTNRSRDYAGRSRDYAGGSRDYAGGSRDYANRSHDQTNRSRDLGTRPSDQPYSDRNNNRNFQGPQRGWRENRGNRGGRRGRGERGGWRGDKPAGQPRASEQSDQKLSFKYDSEFDFESANARFSKEDLEVEFKQKLKLDDGGRTTSEGSSHSLDGGESEEEVVLEEEVIEEEEVEECYDKTKSFFDSISCEGKTNSRPSRDEEREVNTETFGVSSVDGYRRQWQRGWRGRGRGDYRGRNWYRGGRGGGNRGGYYGGRGYRHRHTDHLRRTTDSNDA